jgi:gallate decarboxylase subunit D
VTSSQPRLVRVAARSGTLRLWAVAARAGDDLVVTLGGGARPHVGCVVVAQPHASAAEPGRTRVTASVLAIPPHREEALARPLAEALARALGAVVTVAAGVHDDNLTPEGIATYLRLGERLRDRLLARLGHSSPAPPRR